MNCQAHQFSASSNCGIIARTRVQSRAGNGVNLIFLSRSEACNLACMCMMLEPSQMS